MNTALLIALLEEKIPADRFREAIASEIKEFQASLSKKGSAVYIYLSEEKLNTPFIITKQHFKYLAENFLSGDLEEIHLNYISDALSLSEDFEFESSEVEDLFGGVTDPQVNGCIDREELKNLVKDI